MMEDTEGNPLSQNMIFEQLWNMEGVTDIQNNVHFTYDGGLLDQHLELQIDELQIPSLPLPQLPVQTFPSSIDSGAPPSDLTSEMTTSPGALSVQSPAPQNGPAQDGAASQVIPSNTVWPGKYDFQFSLETCGEHAEKSISWTYSTTLKKLYVTREKNCPINFRTSEQPPPGTILRVLPIFQTSGSVPEVVKRCPHHMGEGSVDSANHVVICQDPSTVYETDPITGRHSLTLPLLRPQAGNKSLQYLFKFMCFMSCVGGLNRRPIQLIFTLEQGGQTIGRQVLDTRICACPGRDRKSDEKNKEKPKKGTKRPKQVTKTVAFTSLNKKKKTEEKEKEIFLIRVEGREKYETLMKIKEALDLMEMATPEQRAACRSRQEQIKKMPVAMLSSYNGSSQSSQGSTIVPTQQQNPPPPQPMVLHPTNNLTPFTSHLPAQQPCLTNVTQADFSDLLGHNGLLSTQPFDTASMNPPMSSQHSYTQLQAVPSLCRGDTLPVLSNLSPSLQQYLVADQPDGPQRMDVSSSQQQSPPFDTVSPTASENQVTSSMDKSIHGWLDSIGFSQYNSIFQEKGFNTVDCLDDISLEFFNETGIPHQDREAMWKHILSHRQRKDRLNATPPLQRFRSDASTISNISQTAPGSQGQQMLRATRYTLKQTLSFKVKEEEIAEDET